LNSAIYEALTIFKLFEIELKAMIIY